MNYITRHYKKGDIIYEQGNLEIWMYDLTGGTVGIYANYGQPDEFLLTEIKGGPGATLGTIGMLDAMRRSATAVALDDVEANLITGELFGEYFQDNPEALLQMMKNMSKRIRELTAEYLEVCSQLNDAVEKQEDKHKSGWFMEHIGKFINDHAEAIANAAVSRWIY